MRIIVQKFGGTSLRGGRERAAAARHVVAAVQDGLHPVVVVSAMGRQGDPYATDTLVDLARDVHPRIPPREQDMLMVCGEIISAVVFAQELRARGIQAVALTGGQAGIVTDGQFGDARILRVEPALLRRHLERGRVPVVAGFQGVTEDGREFTTLGRGGSDTTAAALGVALRAEVVEIYTDVDGVKTADPRLVPEARTLSTATYDEIVQMAHEGARVVHPRAVELAMRGNVPLRIRSTFSDDPGTLITRHWEVDQVWPDLRQARAVTGITHIPGLTQITLQTTADDDQALNVRLFRALADRGISVDMINVSPHRKSFVVRDDRAGEAREALEALGLKPELRPGCAKVTVVGAGMHGVPGVMARVVEALKAAGVSILLTVDSHMTISCLVDGDELGRAVRALHQHFGLGGVAPLLDGPERAPRDRAAVAEAGAAVAARQEQAEAREEAVDAGEGASRRA
ncbi:aspartate kinase [Thermaerobacter marianensis]|uniref:aspartate kinase n=1 Tax=Thermaerobacter marianensis TaxID=73919 RepID=UPI0002E129DD|nr:aspartate kinase [Thermaerobacter marianensis]